MLNDVLSLCVGLWAVLIANKASSKMYTYGWQRAETLGALINGVFLIALCLSIFLEAIQRFVTPQTVSNPKLVLIVGCCGLISNILGLLLFHEHDHGHGEEDEHPHKIDPVTVAEEGHSHSHSHTQIPENTETDRSEVSPQKSTDALATGRSTDFRRPRRTSGSFVDTIPIHPASFRNDIIAASRLNQQSESEAEEEAIIDDDITAASPDERSSLMAHSNGSPEKYNRSRTASHASPKKKRQDHRHDSWHVAHNHSKPKDKSAKEGQSHGDLNMRGVFLHVMGDALGNVGVIASALFIWLTSYKWRFYADPAISLIITVIILASAIPLCRAASQILLQAAPTDMSVDEIKADIEALPNIISAHHLHVWQLSNTRLIASLHVRVDCDVRGSGSAQYMHLATQIRKCLHAYGIHSSTIQPEFCLPYQDGSPKPGSGTTAADSSSQVNPRADRSCLLACDDDCGDNQCCPVTGNDPK